MSDPAEVVSEPTLVALDAEMIAHANDIKSQRIDVPEWGGFVWVRDNPALQAVDLDDALGKLKADGKARESIWTFLAAVLSKQDGSLIFKDAEHARAILGNRSPKVLERVQREAMKFLGMEVSKEKNG